MASPAVDGLKGPSGDRLNPEGAKQLPGSQGRPPLIINERLSNITRKRRRSDSSKVSRRLTRAEVSDHALAPHRRVVKTVV